MPFSKKNMPLAVGISLPIIMIMLVAGSIYIPNFFSQPKFNFLYVTGGECVCSQYHTPYSVKNNKIIKNRSTLPNLINCNLQQNEPKLFIHNTVANKNQEINFTTAQQLNLDPNPTSPDGFAIAHNYPHGSIFSALFYSDTSYYDDGVLHSRYATKKFKIQRLEPCRVFRFIGWIKN